MFKATNGRAEHCVERDNLTAAYIAAVVKKAMVAKDVANDRSEAWREATKQTWQACEEAFQDLHRHKAEHGC